MEELTEKEKEFLTMLVQIGSTIVEASNGSIVLRSYEYFDRNELFNLATKLGVEYY